MKRYVALMACIFALTACGNQSDSDDASAKAQASNGSDNGTSSEGGSTDITANDAEAGDADQSDGGNSETSGSGKAGGETAQSEAGNGESSKSGMEQSETNNGGAESAGNSQGAFANDKEKHSYALGMDIGNSLNELPIEIDTDAMSQGLRDTVGGGDTRLTQKELDGVMKGLVQDMQAEQENKAKEQAQANLDKGKKFLAKNKDKDGVQTTDSGLQYKVIKKGNGPSPDESDTVTVHYVGKLIDGTVFDSSRKRGEPVTFPVDAVIPGWTEALQMMKQGARYELYIPADLAYGERGAGEQIGPNETLIFNVELLKVDKSSADDSAGASNGQGGDQTAGSSDSGAPANQAGSAAGSKGGGGDMATDSSGNPNHRATDSGSAGALKDKGDTKATESSDSSAEGGDTP